MNRRNFFFFQKVTEAELDDAFLQVEEAEKAIKTDMFAGANGFLAAPVTVVEDGPPSQSVDVGTGLGWDKDGFRVSNPNASQLVDFTGDDDPTDPRIVAVYLAFDRALSDTRTDGLGNNVDFKADETFQFNKVLGTPAPGPTPPALDPAQGILIAHVEVPAAAGVISDAEIDTTVQNLQSSFPVGRLRDMNAGMEDAMEATAALAPSTANRVALLSDAAGFADGYISNVKIVTTGAAMPTDTVDVERATAVNGGSSPDLLMNVKNAPLDLGAVVGPGALDVGVVANATYYVYLVGSTTAAAPDDVVASLDSGPGFGGSGPSFANLPNHDRFRLIGVILRVAGEIMPFRQINGTVIFDDTVKTAVFGPGADPHVGGAPGVGSGFILLSLAPFVPAIAERAYLRMDMLVVAAIVPRYHFRSRGGPTFLPVTDYTNVVAGGESAAAGNRPHSESHFALHADVSQDVDWERSETAVASSTLGVFVTGFELDLHHD